MGPVSPSSSPPQKSESKIAGVTAAAFAGPMPPPAIFAGYEQACPGLADRIAKMAEVEAEHRRSLEASIVAAQIQADRRDSMEARCGQICALLITLTALGLGCYTAVHGQQIAGSIIGVGGIGSIVTTFIIGKQKDKQSAASSDQPRNNKEKGNR